MIRHFLLVSTTLFSLGVAGCTSTPVTPQEAHVIPDITFEHLRAIPVQVSAITVTSDTQRGAQAWDIADTMITPPDVAMRRYLQQRYTAAGRDGLLDIDLSRATVEKSSVPNENKLLSFTSLANNDDYTIEIIVDMTTKYVSGQPDRVTSRRFVRKTRMPVNVTMAYREAKLQQTLEEMVRDMDQALTRALSDQLGLIAQNDIPAGNIAVKTTLPEHQTKIGRELHKIREDAKEMMDDLAKEADSILTAPEMRDEENQQGKELQPTQ